MCERSEYKQKVEKKQWICFNQIHLSNAKILIQAHHNISIPGWSLLCTTRTVFFAFSLKKLEFKVLSSFLASGPMHIFLWRIIFCKCAKLKINLDHFKKFSKSGCFQVAWTINKTWEFKLTM